MLDAQYIDSLVLKALREDDTKALSHLYGSQYNRLFRTGLRMGADSETIKESIQDVFHDLWQYRHSLGEIASFEAYLKVSLKRRIGKTLAKMAKSNIPLEASIEERERDSQLGEGSN